MAQGQNREKQAKGEGDAAGSLVCGAPSNAGKTCLDG